MGGGLWTPRKEKKQMVHSLRAVCLVGLHILPPALAAGGTSWEPSGQLGVFRAAAVLLLTTSQREAGPSL